MNSEQIKRTQRILNAFENDSGSPETDYSSVYIYHDGNNDRRQVTLARGFTEDGGNLKLVIQKYIDRGGEEASYFSTKLGQIGRGILADDKEFISKLKEVGDEQVMHDVQDEVFEDRYMGPALKWADNFGFKEALSQAVIVDSYLHSGSMLDFLMARFPEKKPTSGGDEKTWINQYLVARYKWLKGHAKPVLRTTTYRPEFFLHQVNRNNWNLDCPLTAHDVRVC